MEYEADASLYSALIPFCHFLFNLKYAYWSDRLGTILYEKINQIGEIQISITLVKMSLLQIRIMPDCITQIKFRCK